MNCAPQIAAFAVPVQQVRRLWKLRWAGWLCAAVLSLFSAERGLCQQAAPVLLSQPQSTNVYLGSPAAFSVTASGSVPLRYLWSGPAGAIQDATNNTLSLPQVGIQDLGAYFVKVSNQFGSTQSTSAVLSVKQDWGDAPAQYPTLFNAGGARHAIVSGMYLGSGVTPEPDGQPDVAASADQADDGIALVSPLVRGYPCKVRVVASIAGRLDGWLDFYANGNWSDPVDQIFASTPIAAGTNFLLFNVPTDAAVNNTFARFRYSSQGGLRFGGPAPDGEVEDYMLRVLPAAADLCVTATAFLNPGGTAGYAGRCFLSVSNLGPSVAVNVLASNILAGADNLAAQGDGSCTVQGEKVVCALGNIEPGQVKSIVIDFSKAQPGVLTNAFQAHSDLPDPFPLNNRTNFTIRAADSLVLLKSPVSIRVLPGSNVIFSVEAKGAGPLTYQWVSNNVAVAGATGSLFMVENAQDSADFQVQVADAFGSILSPVATLTVVRRPQVLAQPSPVSAPHGANIQFAAQVSGTPPLQFQWRLNGANIPGATNPVFTLNGIARTDAGAYTLAVANDAGVASSAPAPLICSDIPTLNPADNFSDRIALPTGNNLYQGFIQTLNGNATVETGEPDLAAKPGGHSVWFKWTAPASGIATFDTIGSTFDTLLGVFTGTNFATLSEVASDEDSGGFFRSLVQFNAKAGQVYAISVDGFSGRSGNVVLGWTLEPTTQLLPVFVQHPRSQTVLEGASVTLTVQVSNATPNTLYQWVFNGKVLPGVSGPDLLIPKVRPPNVGIYSVRVMDPAGRNVESRPAAIEIGTNPNVQSQDKLEDVLLNATGSAGFAFAKSLGFPPFVSVALGVPGAQVMNNTNSTADIDCFQIGTATRWLGIQVTNLASVTNCMLRVTTANSGIPTELAVYRYVSLACLQSVPCLHTNIMGCDTNSAGGGGSYSLLEFKPIPNAQYLVFADGLGGAQGIIQMNWQLGAAPAFTSSISNCTLVCDAGTNIIIHCGVTNAIPAPSCQWYYNGSPLAGANGITLSFPAVQPSNAGPYSVTISNAFGMLTNYCCLVVTPPQLNGKATFTNGVPSTYSISSALLPGYVLQYTTNLNAPIVWQNAFTNATTNCSFVHVSPMVDTNGQAYPQRYYRAVSP